MRRHRCIPTLAIVCGLLVATGASAHEPDGRVAFRYEWTASGNPGGTGTLRLTLTLQSELTGVHLQASVPTTSALRLVSARRLEGSPVGPMDSQSWPDEGLALGDLPAGATVVLELGVAVPKAGGGILAFALDATSGGAPVHEGVGVPVGIPGTLPVLRNGAVEFPAGHGERNP